MVVRWSALLTRIYVSDVESFPTFWEDIPKGSRFVSPHKTLVVRYHTVYCRVWYW